MLRGPSPQAESGFARSLAPYRGPIVTRNPVETRKFPKNIYNQRYKHALPDDFYVQGKAESVKMITP